MTLRNDMAQLPAQWALYLIHGAAAGVMSERPCMRCEQPATVPPVYHAQNGPTCGTGGRQHGGAGVRGVPVRCAARGGDADGVRARLLRQLLATAPERADQRGPQPAPDVHGRALRRCLRRGAGALFDCSKTAALCSETVLVSRSGGQPLTAADALRFHTLYLSSPRLVTAMIAPS